MMSYLYQGKKCAPTVWMYECGGRLANRLFRWGYFLGDAIENGYTVIQQEPLPHNLIPDRHKDSQSVLQCLDAEQLRKLGFEEPRCYRLYQKISGARFFKPVNRSLGIIDLRSRRYPQAKHYLLAGQEFKALLDRSGQLAVFGYAFRAKPQLLKNLNVVKALFGFTGIQGTGATVQRGESLIGVHVRRGDYAGYNGGKYFYELDYYRELANQLSTELNAKAIMFCSESSDRAYFIDQGYAVGSADPVEDLHLLAQSQYIVGPPSTFSLWSALMGESRIHQLYEPAKELHAHDFRRVSEEIMP